MLCCEVELFFIILYNRELGSAVSGGCIGSFNFFMLKVECAV